MKKTSTTPNFLNYPLNIPNTKIDFILEMQIVLEASSRAFDTYKMLAFGDITTMHKVDDSPLTNLDIALNTTICESLSARYHIVSEEGKNREKAEIFYLVDPLDGTRDFLANNGEFALNVALIVEGKAILGLIGLYGLGVSFIGFKDKIFAYFHTEKTLKSVDFCFLQYYLSGVDLRAKTAIEILQIILNCNEAFRDFHTKSISRELPNSRSDRQFLFISHFNAKDLEIAQSLQNMKNLVPLKVGASLKYLLLCFVGGLVIRNGNSSNWDIASGNALLKASGGTLKEIKSDLSIMQELNYPTNDFKNPYFMAVSVGNEPLLETLKGLVVL